MYRHQVVAAVNALRQAWAHIRGMHRALAAGNGSVAGGVVAQAEHMRLLPPVRGGGCIGGSGSSKQCSAAAQLSMACVTAFTVLPSTPSAAQAAEQGVSSRYKAWKCVQ